MTTTVLGHVIVLPQTLKTRHRPVTGQRGSVTASQPGLVPGVKLTWMSVHWEPTTAPPNQTRHVITLTVDSNVTV